MQKRFLRSKLGIFTMNISYFKKDIDELIGEFAQVILIRITIFFTFNIIAMFCTVHFVPHLLWIEFPKIKRSNLKSSPGIIARDSSLELLLFDYVEFCIQYLAYVK